MNRIALGTVQFGLPYGIANQRGQVSVDEARLILTHAHAAGVEMLDTAIAYGNSEQRLGEMGVQQWQVVSKLPAVPNGCVDIRGWVYQSVEESLQRLQVNHLRGLLLHRPEQLLSVQGEQLYAALSQLVSDGLVRKIGVSIYEPDEFQRLGEQFDFGIVQIPFNILDHRLLDSGLLHRLCQQGTEVHVRSVFLQGLLLMHPAERPPQFEPWRALWQRWQGWLEEVRLSPLQACLLYVMSFPGIAKVIVGVDSLTQLKEILQAAEGAIPEIPSELNCTDIDLINPSRWAMV